MSADGEVGGVVEAHISVTSRLVRGQFKVPLGCFWGDIRPGDLLMMT